MVTRREGDYRLAVGAERRAGHGCELAIIRDQVRDERDFLGRQVDAEKTAVILDDGDRLFTSFNPTGRRSRESIFHSSQ